MDVAALESYQKGFLGFTLLLVMLLSLPGNLLVCYMVCRNHQMRSAINALLLSMAFGDVLLSIFCMPFDLAATIISGWKVGGFTCQAQAFLLNALLVQSGSILALISLDRYLIIVHRKDVLNFPRVRWIAFGIWIYSGIVAAIPWLGWSGYVPQPGYTHCEISVPLNTWDISPSLVRFSCTFVLPGMVMVLSYMCIANSVRRNGARIQVLPRPARNYVQQSQRRRRRTSPPHKTGFLVDVRFKTRTFATILMLFGLFLACRGPYLIAIFIANVSGIRLSAVTYTILQCCCYANAALVPVMYHSRIKKFRETFQHVLPEACTKSRFSRKGPCGNHAVIYTVPVRGK